MMMSPSWTQGNGERARGREGWSPSEDDLPAERWEVPAGKSRSAFQLEGLGWHSWQKDRRGWTRSLDVAERVLNGLCMVTFVMDCLHYVLVMKHPEVGVLLGKRAIAELVGTLKKGKLKQTRQFSPVCCRRGCPMTKRLKGDLINLQVPTWRTEA